jgi:hypothetical protein
MIDVADILEAEGPRLVALYLQAGWAYERQGRSFMTDAAWDQLCRTLDAEWDWLPQSSHKAIIRRDALASGTAYYLTDKVVPTICKVAALTRLEEHGPGASNLAAGGDEW